LLTFRWACEAMWLVHDEPDSSIARRDPKGLTQGFVYGVHDGRLFFTGVLTANLDQDRRHFSLLRSAATFTSLLHQMPPLIHPLRGPSLSGRARKQRDRSTGSAVVDQGR